MIVACEGEGVNEDIREILHRYGSTLGSNSKMNTNGQEFESRFLKKGNNDPRNILDFGAFQPAEHSFKEISTLNIENKATNQTEGKCDVRQGIHSGATNTSMVNGWTQEALYRCGENCGQIHKNTRKADEYHSQLRLCGFEGKHVVYDELNLHGICSRITAALAENKSTLQGIHDRSLVMLKKH